MRLLASTIVVSVAVGLVAPLALADGRADSPTRADYAVERNVPREVEGGSRSLVAGALAASTAAAFAAGALLVWRRTRRA